MICRICEKYKTCDSPYCGDSSMIHCGNYEKAKPIINGDIIRAMTDEELADFLCKVACNTTSVGYYHIEGWLEWLKQESENLNE